MQPRLFVHQVNRCSNALDIDPNVGAWNRTPTRIIARTRIKGALPNAALDLARTLRQPRVTGKIIEKHSQCCRKPKLDLTPSPHEINRSNLLTRTARRSVPRIVSMNDPEVYTVYGNRLPLGEEKFQFVDD